MNPLSLRKRKFIFGLSLLIALLSFFFLLLFKEKLAFYWIKIKFDKTFSSSVLSAKNISLWPGFATVENFEIKKKSRASSGLEVRGGKGFVKFSTVGMFRPSFLAMESAHFLSKSLQYGEFAADGIDLEMHKNHKENFLDFFLAAQKFRIKGTEGRNLTGHLRAEENFVFLEDLHGAFLAGTVVCSGRLIFKYGSWILDLKVHAQDIEMNDLMKMLSLQKRLNVSGVFTGDITLILENGLIKALKGDLRNLKGGQFIITDISLLDKNILINNGANIVIENLKNYHYDIGSIKLGNNGQNVGINVLLEGPAGRRDLQVMWHR